MMGTYHIHKARYLKFKPSGKILASDLLLLLSSLQKVSCNKKSSEDISLSRLAAVKSTTQEQDKETTFIFNSNKETQRTGKTQPLTLMTPNTGQRKHWA